MITEGINISGQVHAVLTDEFGNVKYEHQDHNMVVTVGKNYIASRMTGSPPTAISHMAVGSGTTAPAIGQTALVTELGRVAITALTASTNVVTITATFGLGVGTGNIAECGLFNASTGGTMISRSTNVIVTKGANDTLTLTWTLTFN